MNNSVRIGIGILLMSAVLIGCDSNRLYEAYHDFQTPSWYVEDTISFDIQPHADIPNRQVLVTRYTDRYAFHNLYLKMVISDSLDQVLKDTLINISLFDPKSGKPLGKGYGNRFTKYDTLTAGSATYAKIKKIKFQQYMRKDTIEGIESLGLKLIRIPS